MKDISIFVSSTFLDMQSERDLLRERILPDIEDYVKKYGININFIDLRWGIDTSEKDDEESTKIIIKSCVDEIVGSKPYFISLVGERYGWIPDLKYIENALYALDVTDPEGFKDISITEFEIRVAEYLSKADIRSLYFLRDAVDFGGDTEWSGRFVSDDPDDRARIDALKKHIRGDFPDSTFAYGAKWDGAQKKIVGLDKFCELVTDALKKLIDRDFAGSRAADNKAEEYFRYSDSFVAASNAVFRGREKELALLKSKLSAAGRLYAVTGPSGNGKSSLVCKLTELLKAEGDVYAFFTGVHQSATNVRFMLNSFIYELTGVYEERDFDGAVSTFYSALSDLKKDRTHYFVIDAVDRMDIDADFESLNWLNTRLIPDNVKFIVSTTDDFYLFKRITALCNYVIRIGGIAVNDVADVSAAYFKKNHKTAANDIVKAIVEKTAEVKRRSPLYLKYILNRIINLGGTDFSNIDELKKTHAPIEAIGLHIKSIISDTPFGIDDCYRKLIDGMRGEFPDGFSDAALIALSYSEHGVGDRQLELILTELGIAFTAADFSYFIKLIREFLYSRNFMYAFNHMKVRSVVQKTYDNSPLKKRVFDATVRLLARGAFDEEFTQNEFLNFAVLDGEFGDYAAYLENNHSSDVVVREFVSVFGNAKNMPAFEALIEQTDDTDFFLSLISGRKVGAAAAKGMAAALLNKTYRGDMSLDTSKRRVYDIYTALGAYFYGVGRYEEALNLYLLLRRFGKKSGLSPELMFKLNIEIGRTALKGGKLFTLLSLGKKLDYEGASDEDRLQARAVMAELSGTYFGFTNALFKKRASKKLTAIVEEMAGIAFELDDTSAVYWFGVIADFLNKNKAAVGGENVSRLAERLSGTAIGGTDGIKANIALSRFYFESDIALSREYLKKARELSDTVGYSRSDAEALWTRHELLKYSELFERDGEKLYADLDEELNILTALSNMHYDYELFEEQARVLHELKKRKKDVGSARLNNFKNMLTSSKGLRTPMTRQVDKIAEIILVAFLLLYLVLPMFLFVVWGDYFARVFDYTDSIDLVFGTLDNAFQTVYNLAFCFAYFGVMYMFKQCSRFLDKKEWAIKLIALIILIVVIDYAYYRFVLLDIRTFRLSMDKVQQHYIWFKYLLAVGFTLVVHLLYEGYLFIQDELKARSAEEKYVKFVVEYKKYAIDAAIRVGFMIFVAIAYYFVMKGRCRSLGSTFSLTRMSGVCPSVMVFWAIIGVLIAFVAARFVYTLVIRRRLKAKYE